MDHLDDRPLIKPSRALNYHSRRLKLEFSWDTQVVEPTPVNEKRLGQKRRRIFTAVPNITFLVLVYFTQYTIGKTETRGIVQPHTLYPVFYITHN